MDGGAVEVQRGAEGLVAGDEGVEGGVEGGGVDGAVEVEVEVEVVEGVVGVQRRVGPDAGLLEALGERVGAVDCGDRVGSGGEREVGGEAGGGAELEDVGDADRAVQAALDQEGELGSEEGVAAEEEEVVVGFGAGSAQHLIEEGGQAPTINT